VNNANNLTAVQSLTIFCELSDKPKSQGAFDEGRQKQIESHNTERALVLSGESPTV